MRQWVKFATLLRKDDGDNPQGKIQEPSSFLEDLRANQLERWMSIHGAWYKTSPNNQWETIKKVHTSYIQSENYQVSGNEEARPGVDAKSGKDLIFVRTGGRNVGNQLRVGNYD